MVPRGLIVAPACGDCLQVGDLADYARSRSSRVTDYPSRFGVGLGGGLLQYLLDGQAREDPPLVLRGHAIVAAAVRASCKFAPPWRACPLGPLARSSAWVSLHLVEIAALVTDDACADRPGDTWHVADPFVPVDVASIARRQASSNGAPVARLGRVGGAAVARGPAAGRRSSADAGA